MTETASSDVPSAIVTTCCHMLYQWLYTWTLFNVVRDPVRPPRKYSEGVHCTVHCTVYSKESKKFPNVKDQHNIPHSGISYSFKYFLTDDKDLIVDCNHRVTSHSPWKPCCQGDPVSFIKHLSGVQIFVIIKASTDN